MRLLLSYNILFAILIHLHSVPVFAQNVRAGNMIFSYEETKWVNQINGLISRLTSSDQDTPILEQINKILFRKFEKNLLHPPLLNITSTAAKRKAMFVHLIKAMIAVRDKTQNNNNLIDLLNRFTEKIFGVPDNKGKIELSKHKLQWVGNLFKGMDKELRGALFEINDPNMIYFFYTRLYFNLMKIDKLLNLVYEYGDQKPFEDFIGRFDPAGLQSSFKELQSFFTNVGFINAEIQLKKMLLYYYKKMDRNIWEYPDLTISRNINIPVFVHVLKKHMGRLKESYKYEPLVRNLLEHIGNKRFLIRDVKFNAHMYYNAMIFFNFIYQNLLLPAEVKKSPFLDNDRNIIPMDKLINKKNKITISTRDGITDRKKVDGSLRQLFCRKMLNFDILQAFGSQTQMVFGFSLKKIQKMRFNSAMKNVFAAIFLPNIPYNNAGDEYDIEEYNWSKRELFLTLKTFLGKAQKPKLISNLLKSILRLNKSYRRGSMQLPFYIITSDIYRKYYNRLGDDEKEKMNLVRLKLGLANKKVANLDDLKIAFNDMRSVVNDLSALYKIETPDLGTFADVIRYRLTFDNLDEEIDQVEKIGRIKNLDNEKIVFYLISNLKNILNILDGLEGLMKPRDVKDAFLAINGILDVYHNYLPFLSNIDASSIIDNKNSVALMSLLNNDEVKLPFIFLNNEISNREDIARDEVVVQLNNKIILKLIMHNFLLFEVIFRAIEQNDNEIFAIDQKLEHRLLDYDLLFPVTESQKISTRRLIDDTMESFDLNLDLLNNVGVEFFYRYIFSNLGEPFKKVTPELGEGQKINCFDDVIKKALKVGALNIPSHIKSRIDQFIQAQTGSFSNVYQKLGSVFNIQRMWEMILARTVDEASNQDRAFARKYNVFYMQGNFVKGDGQGSVEFRDEIQELFKDNFYSGHAEKSDLEKYLVSYFKLCSGENKGNLGIKGVIDKYGSSNLQIVKTYKSAAVDLMQKIFQGKGLQPQEWYIGQMFYDNQKKSVKPIAESDLFSDDFYRIYDWIWESGYELADYPELRHIFLEDNIRHASLQ